MSSFLKVTCIIICLSFSPWAYGQYEDLVFDNEVYLPNLSTVKFHRTGSQHSYPVIPLGGSIRLELSFDDMDADFKDYYYKIIHCDKNWNPSDLDELDYMDGFNEVEIRDFAGSVQSKLSYTHYSFRFPNDDIRPQISGNYLLAIYEDEYETTPAITRRFMIFEEKVNLTAMHTKPSDVSKFDTHHEFSVSVDTKSFYISDPQDELEIFALQNGRWDNAIKGQKADYIVGNKLEFRRNGKFSFPALKEFRFFDIRTLSYARETVLEIEYDGREIYALLEKDPQRYNRVFMSEYDLNGDFVIENKDRNDDMHKSEYVHVIFNLEAKVPYALSDIYLVGGFSDWKPKEEYKLLYNSDQQLYQAECLFKQGYYNYMYAVVDKEDQKMSLETIEGNWFETENEYLFLCYFSEFGSRYDRIVDYNFVQVNKP